MPGIQVKQELPMNISWYPRLTFSHLFLFVNNYYEKSKTGYRK